MKITFDNKKLFLNPDGSIFWEDEQVLILTDLHLEKGSSYANLGNYLPPYDSLDTLIKLTSRLKTNIIKKIFLLGDVFHDYNAYNRMGLKEKNIFDAICNNNEIIWIFGNHEKGFFPPRVTTYNSYKFKGVIFNHTANKQIDKEISGHYHPKVSFLYKNRKLSRPCFLVSKKKIILPSYGSFTGGLNMKSKVIKDLFTDNFNVYALGNTKVIPIK